jgi:hypothetical protein
VLFPDSFGPRDVATDCEGRVRAWVERSYDAYGALRYLQAQSFVIGERIGVMGWSHGGGTVIFAIAPSSIARPADLPEGDFRAAVAFYPAWCSRLPADWKPDEVASRYADIANTDFHAPRDAIVLAQLRCPLAGTDLKSLARNLQPRPEAVLVEAAAGRKDRVVDNDPALRHVGGAGRDCPQIPLGALIDNSELQRLHGPCVGGTLRPLGRFLAMAR